VGTTVVQVYRSDGSIGYHLNGERGCLFGASHPDRVVVDLVASLRDWGITGLELYGGAEIQALGGGTALPTEEVSRIRQALIAEGFTVT